MRCFCCLLFSLGFFPSPDIHSLDIPPIESRRLVYYTRRWFGAFTLLFFPLLFFSYSPFSLYMAAHGGSFSFLSLHVSYCPRSLYKSVAALLATVPATRISYFLAFHFEVIFLDISFLLFHLPLHLLELERMWLVELGDDFSCILFYALHEESYLMRISHE